MTTKTIDLEIEVKIKVEALEAIKSKILEDGFQVADPYSFEHNVVFDTPGRRLRKNHHLLRLRKINRRYILTFKRPPRQSVESGDYKIREEIETEVSDFENTRAILIALGYRECFIYEKYREIYARGKVKVMLDRTPIGDYIEIEGEPGEIDRLAVRLGYNKGDYITDNYMTLFRKKHKTGHMQFPGRGAASHATPGLMPSATMGLF